MNTRPQLALVLALCALLTGCGDAGIVGKWHGTVSGNDRSVSTDIELAPNGKETIQVSWASPGGQKVTIVTTATYTVKGNAITQTFTGFTLDGRAMPVASLPENQTTETDTFKLNGDTLILSKPSSPAMTLTRVKN